MLYMGAKREFPAGGDKRERMPSFFGNGNRL